MKIAVLGYGRQGKRRYETLSKMDGITTGVYDIIRPQNKDRIFDKIDDAVDWSDAVAICVPSTIHIKIAEDAINEHKHVLIEKPLALTAQDAWKLVSLAEKAGVALHCGLNMRYRSPVLGAKEIIDKIGSVTKVSARMGHCQFALDRGERFLTSGGSLLDLGTHALDVIMDVLGWPSIHGLYKSKNSDKTQGFLKLWTDTGAIIDLETSFMDFRPGVGSMIEFHGSHGKIRIDMADSSVTPLDRLEIGLLDSDNHLTNQEMKYDFPDECWNLDCAAFLNSCKNPKVSNAKQAAYLVELLS